MNSPSAPFRRILIAGVGNIFFGDDAFGSEVARRLAVRTWPDGVRVEDFGIRGLDLVYALMDGYDCTIVIDAAPRGGEPGTLYVIEPDLTGRQLPRPVDATCPPDRMDGHSMHFEQAARLAAEMGGALGKIILIGCEPAPAAGEDEMAMGLSAPVQGAIDRAVTLVEELLNSNLSPQAHAHA